MQRDHWLGVVAGLGCVLIWGGQSVITRQAVQQGLTPADITVLRFVVAGVVLLPIALRMRPPLAGRLGWARTLLFSVLVGAPYSLLIVGGLTMAPAVHQAVIGPASIPLFAAILAWLFAGEKGGRRKGAGLALVMAGIAVFFSAGLSGAAVPAGAWRGDLLFMVSAAMWAVFGLLSQRWRADALESAASTCVVSLLSVPLWMFAMPTGFAHVPTGTILWQAFYHGILVGAVALFLYARAVELLGSASAALFLPLMPVVTAIGAWLWLGEQTTLIEVAGMLLVGTGMVVAMRPAPREPAG